MGDTNKEVELSPQDIDYIIGSHQFEPRKLRRDQRGYLDPRERLAYGHHFRRLNAEGRTYRTIAAEFDCGSATVQRLIFESREASLPVAREQANKAELDVLEVLADKVMPRALSDDPDVAGPAIMQALKIIDLRAKLTGAFAPVQVEAQVVQVTQEDLEMQELVREAKARETTVAVDGDRAAAR